MQTVAKNPLGEILWKIFDNNDFSDEDVDELVANGALWQDKPVEITKLFINLLQMDWNFRAKQLLDLGYSVDQDIIHNYINSFPARDPILDKDLDLLIRAGANPMQTPSLLGNFVSQNNDAVVERLLSLGVNVSDEALSLSVNNDSNLPMARMLLESGGNPNAMDDEGSTCLTTLAGNNRLSGDWLKLFLEFGADLNMHQEFHSSKGAPMHIAVFSGHKDNVKELLSIGADIDVRDGSNSQSTPLIWLLEWQRDNSHEMIRLLLDKGANPNTPNLSKENPDRAFSPLYIAVKNDNLAATILMEAGAHPDVGSYIKETGEAITPPLHLAVERNNFNLVGKLIRFGANPSVLTSDGKTAKEFAKTDKMRIFLEKNHLAQSKLMLRSKKHSDRDNSLSL